MAAWQPEDFLRSFALPLVRGGELHVGAPLGRGGLLRLQAAVDRGLDTSDTGQELQAARHGLTALLLSTASPPRLDGDPQALRVLVALHDLLFLLHPAAQELLLKERRLRRVAEHAIALCEHAAADTGTAALSEELLAERHSLLHGLWTLSRNDVRVSFWAGRREFQGQEPPARLLLWRGVRRVQEERWRVICYLQLLGVEAGLGRRGVEALLFASPLTDLLTPKRLDPPLHLGRHAPLLRYPRLSRAVAYRYLEQGLPEVGSPLGLGLLQLLGQAPRPRRLDVMTVLCFVSHLHLCALLGAGSFADDPKEGVDKLVPPLSGDGALRDFYGVYGALFPRFPALCLPADVKRSPALLERTAAYARACASAAGPARTQELLHLCARALSVDLARDQAAPSASPSLA